MEEAAAAKEQFEDVKVHAQEVRETGDTAAMAKVDEAALDHAQVKKIEEKLRFLEELPQLRLERTVLLDQFKAVKAIVLAIGFIMALVSLEISVGPLLALVGATGFAVAFALQDSLSNFASGLMIMFSTAHRSSSTDRKEGMASGENHRHPFRDNWGPARPVCSHCRRPLLPRGDDV